MFPVNFTDPNEIRNSLTHSGTSTGREEGPASWDGVTGPNFVLGKIKGTKTNIKELDESAKYSWQGAALEGPCHGGCSRA